MNFIQNYEAIFILRQVEFRIGKLGAVGLKLQIYIRSTFMKNFRGFQRERRLADLHWTQQADGREMLQPSTTTGIISRSITL